MGGAVALFFLSSASPHDSSNFSSSAVYLTFTIANPSLSSIPTSKLLATTVIVVTMSLYFAATSPLTRTNPDSVIFMLAAVLVCVVASWCYLILPFYVMNLLALWNGSKRFCAPSQDEVSRVAKSILLEAGYVETSSCGVADLVFVPVPWIEESRVPGTSFGGIHRSSRVNQIPYGNSRICHKHALNHVLNVEKKLNDTAPEHDFYPLTYITEKDEAAISKAQNLANHSHPWIVKASEGRAKKKAISFSDQTVFVANEPFQGLAKLKGVGLAQERADRKSALTYARQRETDSGDFSKNNEGRGYRERVEYVFFAFFPFVLLRQINK